LGIDGASVIARGLLLASNQIEEAEKIEVPSDCFSPKENFEANVNDVETIKLHTFCAGRNRLQSEGMMFLTKAFSRLTTLKRLELPQNGIKLDGLQELCKSFLNMPQLEVLNLNDNLLHEEGAVLLSKTIVKLPQLKDIDVGDCLINSIGAIAIARVFQDKTACPTLRRLTLSYSDIGNKGAFEVAKAIEGRESLLLLNLNGNRIKAKGLEAINSALGDRSDVLGNMEANDDWEEEGEVEEEEDPEEALAALIQNLHI